MELEDGKDYKLENGSCWITVRNVSVHIVNHRKSVAVHLYPLGKELDRPLDTAIVPFSEA